MIEVKGEHLSFPASIRLDGGLLTWTYSIKPRHKREESARLDEVALSLELASWRGIEPAHPLTVLGGIGLIFDGFDVLGGSLIIGAVLNALARFRRRPHVLVLRRGAEEFKLLVEHRSMSAAHELVSLRAAH